jgi:hypothetical protein
MTSAYHSHHTSMKSFLGKSMLNEFESMKIMTQESRDSMPFKFFCNAVYQLGTSQVSKDASHELISDLFRECMSKPNPKLEVYILLKLLAPKHDHLSVYGFKTIRLIRLLSVVLGKQGRIDDAAALTNWLKSPPLQESLLKSEGIVSLPELKIAAVMCSKNTNKSKYDLTIQDIGLFCRKLTEGYICVPSKELDSFQVEAWLEIAQHLEFEEWVCLIRIVLKKISMGMGISNVLNQVPYIHANEYFRKQFNLEKLALNIVLHHQDPTSMWKKQIPHLVCGTPFVPMTCHSLKSPYLFQWMFLNEENTDGKFIAPKDGRLVISSINDGWYIPMSHNAKQKTFVSIHERNAMHNSSRREHIKLLQEIKKNKLLKTECCYGLVIHYTLKKVQNSVVFLIRNVSDARMQNIQLFNNEENDMDVEKAKNKSMHLDFDLTKQKNIENIIAQIKNVPVEAETEQVLGQEPEPRKGNMSATIVIETVFENSKNSQTILNSKDNTGTPARSKTTSTPMLASSKKGKSKIKLEDIQQQLQINQKSKKKTLIENNEESSENSKSKESVKKTGIEKLKAIVQLKYDGDRIQIHVQRNLPSGLESKEDTRRNIVELKETEEVVEIKSSALKHHSEMFGIKVQLFTKWGKNVTELYSSIQQALENNKELKMYAPCVFDAELILVNEKNEPLPWCSEKWRYNASSSFSAGTDSISKIIADSGMTSNSPSENIIVFSHETPSEIPSEENQNFFEEMGSSTLNNDADNEDGGEGLLFGTVQGLKKWSGIGSNDLVCLRGREIQNKGIHLQCVIFDILMHEEREVCQLSYQDRLQILEGVYKTRVFKDKDSSFQCIRIISDSVFVGKVQELQTILKHVVEKRWEGLVIKDPRSNYVFGKTNIIQKLKINGPDINCSVIGCGFSLSKNPRQWGFLTGISVGREEKFSEHLSYCRVEYMEGESPWVQFIQVLNLKSTIKTSSIIKRTNLSFNGPRGVKSSVKKNAEAKNDHVIKLEHCVVSVQGYRDESSTQYYKIDWNYLNFDEYHLNFALCISKQHLTDIQWLSNPLECQFQLSVRGDLEALVQKHCANHISEKPLVSTELCVPRNPVGRIEWKGVQHSNVDSAASIFQKFESHRAWETLLQRNLVQNISKLRKISHHSDIHLQLARKMLLGYEMFMNSKKKLETQEWPQVPPKIQFSIQDYDQLLRSVNELLPATVPQLPPLSKEEKLILLKIPSLPKNKGNNIVTQHSDLKSKNATEIIATNIISEENSFDREQRKNHLEMLTNRLRSLQKQFIDNDQKIVIHTTGNFSSDKCDSEPIETECQCVVSPYFISGSEEESSEDESKEEVWDYLPAGEKIDNR